MPAYRVRVEFADGDNWDAERQISEVEVEAVDALQAKLLGEQMVYTPMPGKPDHIQITGSTVVPVPPPPFEVDVHGRGHFVAVTEYIWRSWTGARRKDGEPYDGPVYLLGSDAVSPPVIQSWDPWIRQPAEWAQGGEISATTDATEAQVD